MAKIIVNGIAQVFEGTLTVAELIRLNQVEQPDMVSVQVNEEFLDRDNFGSHELHDGDVVDFLYFMGGGQCYV